MTDLEMTKLCAEAMGLSFDVTGKHVKIIWQRGIGEYRPLEDDFHAMALVRRFEIDIRAPGPPVWNQWAANCWITPNRYDNAHGMDTDLNRAIVVCVADMQTKRLKASVSPPDNAEDKSK